MTLAYTISLCVIYGSYKVTYWLICCLSDLLMLYIKREEFYQYSIMIINCNSMLNLPSASIASNISCISASLGFAPSDLHIVPASLTDNLPFSSLSQSLKFSSNSVKINKDIHFPISKIVITLKLIAIRTKLIHK